MRRDLAESFSLSFHPLFIPFYSLLFVFVLPIFEVQSLGSRFQMYIVVMVGIVTIGLPILSMRMLKKQNSISSYYLEKREERNIPYLLTLVYFAITSFMLFKIDYIPIIIPLIFIISTVGNLILLIVNLKWKVSAHAMAMGSLTAIIFALHYFYDLNLETPLIIINILSIIIIFSRHYLKAHNWGELIFGFFSGLIISLALSYYFLFPILG